MALFAELDANSVVRRVIVVDAGNAVTEAAGERYCRRVTGSGLSWRETFYFGEARRKYAGIGYSYDSIRNIFVTPKPYPSWVIDPTGQEDWMAPVPRPPDNKDYEWNERELRWDARPS